MTIRNLTRGGLAVALAVVLSWAGFVSPAHADTVGNIDNTRNGSSSLTIHKRSQPNTEGAAATGYEIASPGGNPINGVEFSVYRVGSYDLSTPTGWDGARPVIDGFAPTALDNKTAPTKLSINSQEYPLAPVGTKDTAGQGEAKFSNLSFGLYLVVESNLHTDKTNVVLGSAPFLVTLPYALTSSAPWNYEVHVYPKNTISSVTKTLSNAGTPLGKNLQWTIAATVPRLPAAQTLSKFSVRDNLDPRLAFDRVSSVMVAGKALASDRYNVSTSGRAVTVEFVDPSTLTPGAEVSVVFDTSVTSVGDGTISNKGEVFVNDTSSSSEVVTSSWGQLRILKHAKDNTDQGLTGAEFDLFTDQALQTKVNNTPLVSNAEGIIDVAVLKPGTYYLKETKAPAGYVQRPDAVAVTVVAGEVATSSGQNYVRISNDKQTIPSLPNTGANGELYLIIGGITLILLASGVGLLAIARQRNNK